MTMENLMKHFMEYFMTVKNIMIFVHEICHDHAKSHEHFHEIFHDHGKSDEKSHEICHDHGNPMKIPRNIS